MKAIWFRCLHKLPSLTDLSADAAKEPQLYARPALIMPYNSSNQAGIFPRKSSASIRIEEKNTEEKYNLEMQNSEGTSILMVSRAMAMGGVV